MRIPPSVKNSLIDWLGTVTAALALYGYFEAYTSEIPAENLHILLRISIILSIASIGIFALKGSIMQGMKHYLVISAILAAGYAFILLGILLLYSSVAVLNHSVENLFGDISYVHAAHFFIMSSIFIYIALRTGKNENDT